MALEQQITSKFNHRFKNKLKKKHLFKPQKCKHIHLFHKC